MLEARFNQFFSLLALSAETFHETDLDAAMRLAAVTYLSFAR
ncbi:hypothetical protein [Nocardia sp. NPDC049707]